MIQGKGPRGRRSMRVLAMHLFQILLPLADNAGRPFGQEKFDRVKEDLTADFLWRWRSSRDTTCLQLQSARANTIPIPRFFQCGLSRAANVMTTRPFPRRYTLPSKPPFQRPLLQSAHPRPFPLPPEPGELEEVGQGLRPRFGICGAGRFRFRRPLVSQKNRQDDQNRSRHEL